MSAPADDHGPLAPPRVQEVSDGVYAYIQPDGSWFINNTGFLVGSQGVTSIDACSTERRTRAYLEAIAAVTDAPVRTLVNTHHHGDHTFGNYLFSGAAVIAQERARQEVIDFGPPESRMAWNEVDWGDIRLDPPFVTFTDEIAIHVDELRCQVRHVGTAAHTTNDAIVWIPDRKVLFAGDLLFNGGTPFVLMGSITGAIQAVTQLQQYPAETIVPGHGPVCDARTGAETIETVLGYLHFVQDTAERAKAAGLTPLQAARETDLGPYADLLDAERIAGNLHRAYAELDGAAPGERIDVAAALADMVAYNGGQPLTCYA